MNSTPKDGGPAYPVPNGADVDRRNGMSLRDWFAGQALAGMLANGDISASAARLEVTTEDFRTDMVRTAFQIADEALAHREKGD